MDQGTECQSVVPTTAEVGDVYILCKKHENELLRDQNNDFCLAPHEDSDQPEWLRDNTICPV